MQKMLVVIQKLYDYKSSCIRSFHAESVFVNDVQYTRRTIYNAVKIA